MFPYKSCYNLPKTHKTCHKNSIISNYTVYGNLKQLYTFIIKVFIISTQQNHDKKVSKIFSIDRNVCIIKVLFKNNHYFILIFAKDMLQKCVSFTNSLRRIGHYSEKELILRSYQCYQLIFLILSYRKLLSTQKRNIITINLLTNQIVSLKIKLKCT